MTATLANGGPKEKRRELDYYPTPPDVTKALLIFLALAPCTILEPACGDGAMSRVLEAAGHTVISSDIRHTGFGQGGLDFLAEEPRHSDAIITNPPFAESERFIRKAITESPLVAMLLKSQYWHAQKRAALFAEHPPAWILSLTWRPDFLAGERGERADDGMPLDRVEAGRDGHALSAAFKADRRALRVCRSGSMTPPAKIDLVELTRKATDAFWEVICRAFPQATSGDLSPWATMQQDIANENAVKEWVRSKRAGKRNDSERGAIEICPV